MIHIRNDEVIEPNRNEVNSCPVCDNTRGFAFGTCVSCGFNHIEADFSFIKVRVEHLPKDLRIALVKYHASNYKVEAIDNSDLWYR